MLIYVLEGGTVKATTKDGKSKTTDFKKGQTLWMDAVTHETQNIGKTKLHLLLVELKK
jgi:mannose-6-phosphate isomerase-like protein (cupin superfamily)